jgi:hypothetical protein
MNACKQRYVHIMKSFISFQIFPNSMEKKEIKGALKDKVISIKNPSQRKGFNNIRI